MWLFALTLLFAQDMIEKNIDVKTTINNPVQARKELTDQAIEQASEEMIKAMIGEAKFNRNRAIIREKVLKKSGRYIPFTKASDPKPEGTGYSMSVQLKLSPDNLERLLLENGLFYESDGTPLILSFVQWADRVQFRSYGWWNPTQGPNVLQKMSLSSESKLKSALQKQGFYLLPAQSQRYVEALSKAEQVESLRLEDQQALAQKYSAQIFLTGSISVNRSAGNDNHILIAHLNAMQASNGRSIGEVYRQLELGKTAADSVIEKKGEELLDLVAPELASQVVEAWQRGAFGSDVYRLRFLGAISPADREFLKAQIRSSAKDVKTIKERLLTFDEVIFEIESPLKPQQFEGKLPSFAVKNRLYKFDGYDDREITYRLRRE